MIYTNNLWWNWRWFIIVLPTLPGKPGKPGASTHPKKSRTSSISPRLRVTSALEVGKRPFFWLVNKQLIGETLYIYIIIYTYIHISISFSPMPNRHSKATILEVGNHSLFWCNTCRNIHLFIIIVSQFPSDIPLPATLTSTSRWLALTIHCYAWPCLIYDAYNLIFDECNLIFDDHDLTTPVLDDSFI